MDRSVSLGERGAPYRSDAGGDVPSLRELVVCSLEAWDDIWRRNQFLTDILLRRNADLRVLFVEPPTDPLFDIANRRWPLRPRLRMVSPDSRLWALRPLKAFPRLLGDSTDQLLRWQVLNSARKLGFVRPTLWINDVTYAPLITRTEWSSLYDITDDWLLAPFAPRELRRLRRLDRLALARADAVVVCSTSLEASRGKTREVTLIPNGVDVQHFRRPRPRPADLPPSPVAVYAGSLHDTRLDVELIVGTARTLPELTLAFVGPDSLGSQSRGLLGGMSNVQLLGPRPYQDVPGYLQHADVIIIPHRVTPFTESLDPIKAYECLASGVPTVATPVAGFRELGGCVTVAAGETFAAALKRALVENGGVQPPPGELISWDRRTQDFERVLQRARRVEPVRNHQAGRSSRLRDSRSGPADEGARV